jgi:hypothetical protein
MRHVRFFVVLSVLGVAAALFAVTAFGQTPAGEGYGGQAGPLGGVAEQQSGDAVLQGAQTTGTLPFTGIDLALLVAGGLVLTAVGAGLVRAGARR